MQGGCSYMCSFALLCASEHLPGLSSLPCTLAAPCHPARRASPSQSSARRLPPVAGAMLTPLQTADCSPSAAASRRGTQHALPISSASAAASRQGTQQDALPQYGSPPAAASRRATQHDVPLAPAAHGSRRGTQHDAPGGMPLYVTNGLAALVDSCRLRGRAGIMQSVLACQAS
jgi:hypothetical protein